MRTRDNASKKEKIRSKGHNVALKKKTRHGDKKNPPIAKQRLHTAAYMEQPVTGGLKKHAPPAPRFLLVFLLLPVFPVLQ